MLFVILLGAIARRAVVSADCDIGTVHFNTTDWTNLTGTWYWLYHMPQNYNDNLDCAVTTFDLINSNIRRITTSVYVKSTQTRQQISGTVDWYSNGYVDIYYTEPSPDTKCLSNESCIKNPSYASLWSGRYHLVSGDHRRYYIFEYCCQHLNTICVYVSSRTPNLDEEAVEDLKKELRENGLDFNHLVKWENKHC